MNRALCVVLLAMISRPALAQSRITFGVDGGVAISGGDLGNQGSSGVFGSVSGLVGKPGARTRIGLEVNYQRMQLDSVTYYPPCCDPLPPVQFQGEVWQSYGVMARIEYTITGGLYAMGGAGMLSRTRTPDPDHPVALKSKSTDSAAQAGLGFRIGNRFALEARLINIFTVNASERMFPITAGVRF